MNIRTAIAAALSAVSLLATPVAQAACSDSFNLSAMGPPGVTLIGNTFYSPQHFDDCYNFSLDNSADAFGLTLEWDWSGSNTIDVATVSLSGGGLSGTVFAPSPSSFTFANLLSGAYQLIISGNVTGSGGGYWADPVGYVGVLATTRSFAAPVPEPETYAMLAMGLAVVGWASRRRATQK